VRHFTLRRSNGSPPRVWGRLENGCATEAILRFTPTRVGTTAVRLIGAFHTPVHPHACGDDLPDAGSWAIACGSPPRVWGRRHERDRFGVELRFTPTRVGTTRYQGALSRIPSVHPHACGDDATGEEE